MRGIEVFQNYVHPITAVVIIIVNSVELHCIRKRKQNTDTPFVLFVKHLGIADLLVGITTLLKSVSVYVAGYFPTSEVLAKLTVFLLECSTKYSLYTSVTILIIFTLFKMVMVTKNKRFSRSTVQKICCSIWCGLFIVLTIQSVASWMKLIPEKKAHYLDLAFPILTYFAVGAFIFTYIRIYLSMRNSRRRISMEQVKAIRTTNDARASADCRAAERKLIKIASLSLMSFCACWLPVATYMLAKTVVTIPYSTGPTIRVIVLYIAMLNSIVNSAIYFSIYHTDVFSIGRRSRSGRNRFQAILHAFPPLRRFSLKDNRREAENTTITDFANNSKPSNSAANIFDKTKGWKRQFSENAIECSSAQPVNAQVLFQKGSIVSHKNLVPSDCREMGIVITEDLDSYVNVRQIDEATTNKASTIPSSPTSIAGPFAIFPKVELSNRKFYRKGRSCSLE